MKKLLLLALVALGGVLNVSAAVDIYFKPLDDWRSSNAWFAMYVENTTTNTHSWVAFSIYNDTEHIYKASLDESWNQFVLCRMNPEISIDDQIANDSWDGRVWNQCPNGNNRIKTPSMAAYYENQYEGDNWTSNYYNNSLLPWSYYLVSDKSGSWKADAEMVEGEFTFKASDFAGKYFAVLKGDQIWAESTFKDDAWSYIKRPTNTQNANVSVVFSSDFANYSVMPVTNSSGSVWTIPSDIDNSIYVKISYTEDNSLGITPFFTNTISSLGYATFSSEYNVAVDGATATYITGVGANNALTEANFTDGIPANTGALLYKAGGGDVTFTPAASTPTAASGNKLVAVSSEVTLEQESDGKTNYILTNKTVDGEKTIGFYKANASNKNKVAAGKAYLALDAAVAARDFFWFGDDATAINAAEKASQNVEGYYNLNGQRVAQPNKGLYIVNGKKVIMK